MEERKKFLIQVNQLVSGYSAVANIASLIIQELAKSNDIIILSYDGGIGDSRSGKAIGEFYGLKWYRYNTIPLLDIQKFYKSVNWTSKSNLKKMLLCMKFPREIIQSYDINRNDNKIGVRRSVPILERLIKIEKPDVVISFTVPYEMAEILVRAKSPIKTRKIIYQLDPYAENYLTSKNRYKKRFNKEIQCNEKVDYVLVLKVLYDLYKDSLYKNILGKVIPIAMPCVRKPIEVDLERKIFDEEKVNCVFIGSLYEDIRNPTFLLNIFSQMNNNTIILHFFGSGCENILKSYKKIMGERLFLHGSVSLKESNGILNQADFLINIGNTIKNQTPSKIFDYISTGKPIININKSINDGSEEYLKKYPLYFEIREKKKIKKKDIKLLEEYCVKCKGKRLGYENIKRLFSECTIEHAVKQIMALCPREGDL